MKLKILLPVLLLILSLPIFAQGKSATLIVHHAVIYTLDDKNTIVEAMAVADGKILKTGKNSEILKLKNKKTTVIDA
ncbi:MAG: amidohydrolase, partial [Flavobacterium sp.]